MRARGIGGCCSVNIEKNVAFNLCSIPLPNTDLKEISVLKNCSTKCAKKDDKISVQKVF